MEKVITEKQVKEAIRIIELYKEQSDLDIARIEIKKDNRSLLELNLGTREMGAFRLMEVSTIGELINLDDRALNICRNVGKKSICRVNDALKNIGVKKKFTYSS